ncbi:MAG TPA: N-acetylmuramoyl-L-alanine amidase, partial [Terriglobia bacterium]|nr:N-acetylmuramoyl-L-alanine amidase [Terriglobia bacterium]
GNLGATVPRVAVYTYLALAHDMALAGVPSEEASSAPHVTGARPGLLAWTEVQQDQLPRSRRLAQALTIQFAAVRGVTADQPVEAPVRILRSVDAPAVAIELGSVTSDVDAQPLTSAALQQQLAGAVVHAIDTFLGG